MTLKVLDLFSGIGGFSLGLEMAGPFETVAFVEIDPFCQKVLKKHWPGVPIYDDIKKIQWVASDSEGMRCRGRTDTSKERWDRILSGEQGRDALGSEVERCVVECGQIDLLTGGFPCQPFSCAGKRAGTEDDRHLWPEMLRAIHEIKPRWVLAENVPGLITLQDGLVFEGVCADLEAEGYEVIPLIIPACAQGAPHRRDRIWIFAHSKNTNTEDPDRRRIETSQNNSRRRRQEVRGQIFPDWNEHWYQVALRTCVRGMDARIPNRMDRLKSLGNAVVPKIVCEIGRAILQVEGLI